MSVVEILPHPKSEICHFPSVVWNSQMTPLRSRGHLERRVEIWQPRRSGSSVCVKGEAISGEQALSLSQDKDY